MDVYILPKHIWGKMSPDERDEVRRARTASARARSCSRSSRRASSRASGRTPTTGAASRPSTRSCCASTTTRTRWSPRSRPASSMPPGHPRRSASTQLKKDDSIVTIEGYQGAMTEIAINGGDGLKKPHPALLDPKVREAIGHAIDRRHARRSRAESGFAQADRDAQHLPEPEVDARAGRRSGLPSFDLDQGERDPRRGRLRGHGRRRRPRDARTAASHSTSSYMVRSDSVSAPARRRVLHRLARRDRHRHHRGRSSTTASSRRSSARATTTCSSGAGPRSSTPTRCSSYFTCNQVASDPEDPTNYYNDANYCDPEYDKLYEQQKVELDDQKRIDIVHEMLERQAEWGVYNTLYV